RYAICSDPDEAELRVAVKRGGRLSCFVNSGVRPGDRLDVGPPAGRFRPEPGAKQVVAIAAGARVAPLLPLPRRALTAAPRFRATLLYVNRSGEDTMFADELTALARQFDGRFRLVHFRTDERDPDLWPARPSRPVADAIGTLANWALETGSERHL